MSLVSSEIIRGMDRFVLELEQFQQLAWWLLWLGWLVRRKASKSRDLILRFAFVIFLTSYLLLLVLAFKAVPWGRKTTFWGRIYCAASALIQGPLLGVKNFHPSCIRWCLMHVLHLGLMFDSNASGMNLGSFTQDIYPDTQWPGGVCIELALCSRDSRAVCTKESTSAGWIFWWCGRAFIGSPVEACP